MAEEKAFQVGGEQALAFGALGVGEKDDAPYHQELAELPVPAAAKHDLDLKAKFAEEAHHYFSECIRVADQKAAFLFTGCSVIIAYLFEHNFQRSGHILVAAIFFLLVCVWPLALFSLVRRSAWFAAHVVRPRLWKSQGSAITSEDLANKFKRIRVASQKAAFLFLAWCLFVAGTALIAHLFKDKLHLSLSDLIDWNNQWSKLSQWINGDSVPVTAIAFLMVSAFCAFWAVSPRLWPSHGRHIFWEDVADRFKGRTGHESYSREVMDETTPDAFIREKFENCHDLSRLCQTKYRWLKRAINIGLIGWAITVLGLLLPPATAADLKIFSKWRQAAAEHVKLLKATSPKNSDQYKEAERLYKDGGTKVNGVIELMHTHFLGGEDLAWSEVFDDKLDKAYVEVTAFMTYLEGLSNSKDSRMPREGRVDLETLKQASLDLWDGYRNGNEERRRAILRELQTLKWKPFKDL